MNVQPSYPVTSFAQLPPPYLTVFDSLNATRAIGIAVALIFIVWIIYTFVAGYHLSRYGHRSIVTVPALLIHILVSCFLFLYALSGLT